MGISVIPHKMDLLVWRGTSFELELVSQVKKFLFDHAIHNSQADMKRTHAENLALYGYVWEYVDFSALYTEANLVVMRPWEQQTEEHREPLLQLTSLNRDIELTANSVKIGIAAQDTQGLCFDKGVYSLRLTTLAGKIDGLVYGVMQVKGDKCC